MRSMIWPRAAGALAIGTAILLTAAAPVLADDKLLLELKARLDKLERDNAELKQKLEGKPSSPAPYKAADPDKEKINKQVDAYLKEKDDKKKADDKAKADKLEAEGYEVGKYLDVKGRWNHGMWFETEDKAFRFHAGGRTQIDTAFVHAPKNVSGPTNTALGPLPFLGDYDDGVNFRRARLTVDGTFWEVFDFWCEYDFLNVFRFIPGGNVSRVGVLNGVPSAAANANFTLANTNGTIADRRNIANTPVPTDLWLQWSKIPYVGNIRIGNQKPWFSYEHATSSRFLDFLERSYGFDAFVENGNNGFAPGISAFNGYLDDRLNAAVGVYKVNTVDIFGWNTGDGEYQVAARVWGTPIYEENGRCMLHLGLGYTHRGADDGIVRYRARTMIRNGNAVTHNVAAIIQANAHNENILVPEVAFQYGPFSVSGEYWGVWANQRPGELITNAANQTAALPTTSRGSLFYQSAYVTVGYFLTGEHKIYNQRMGAWDRQAVNESAFIVDGDDGLCFGRGAWQVLARYSWLDLDDRGVNGGIINSLTLGVNWFLNPNAKIQANYEIAYRDVTALSGNAAPTVFQQKAFDGIYQGFGTRLAFDF